MKRKLRVRTINKLRLSNRLKLVYSGLVVSVLLVSGWLIYLNLTKPKVGYASDQSPLLDYSWKRKIQFADQLINADEMVTDFPLLIHIRDSEFRSIKYGGKVIHPNGYDIRFTKSDEKTVLPSQIDSYNALTGELAVWVLLDTLSAKSSKDLTIFYSNATIRSELPSILWNGIYRGIWHMNNLHASNNRKFIATSFGTNEYDGKIGKARLFEASRNDAAFFPSSNDFNLINNFSFSAWIKLNELGREQVVFSNEDGISGGYKFFISKNNKLDIEFIDVAGKHISISQSSEGIALEKDKWYFISGVYSMKESRLITYLNGKEDRNVSIVESPGSSSSGLQIGRELNNNQSYFNGIIDEVRISAEAFNETRFAAEFKNQSLREKLFKVLDSEKIELSSLSVKHNKAGINELNALESSNQEIANNLHAKKLYLSNQAPGTLTSSIEALQSRMDYIRRVSNDNTK
jgi:hypothetical protein